IFFTILSRYFTISFTINIVDDNNIILIHINVVNGTELKNLLNICVNKTCNIPVIAITSRANLFLNKFGIALLTPNSLQFKALNNTLNANTEKTTVPCSIFVAFKILYLDCKYIKIIIIDAFIIIFTSIDLAIIPELRFIGFLF